MRQENLKNLIYFFLSIFNVINFVLNSLNIKYKSKIFLGKPKDSIKSIEKPNIDRKIFLSISLLEKYMILFFM